MEDQTNLAPWAHPKASRWFETLLERSGLIEDIEQQIQQNDEAFDLQSARLLLSILALLGRPGIWPERHRRVLAKVANKANRLMSQQESQTTARNSKRTPMTLEQHQRSGKANEAMEIEIEMVRRWAGASNRQTEIKQPPTWGEYWG